MSAQLTSTFVTRLPYVYWIDEVSPKLYSIHYVCNNCSTEVLSHSFKEEDGLTEQSAESFISILQCNNTLCSQCPQCIYDTLPHFSMEEMFDTPPPSPHENRNIPAPILVGVELNPGPDKGKGKEKKGNQKPKKSMNNLSRSSAPNLSGLNQTTINSKRTEQLYSNVSRMRREERVTPIVGNKLPQPNFADASILVSQGLQSYVALPINPGTGFLGPVLGNQAFNYNCWRPTGNLTVTYKRTVTEFGAPQGRLYIVYSPDANDPFPNSVELAGGMVNANGSVADNISLTVTPSMIGSKSRFIQALGNCLPSTSDANDYHAGYILIFNYGVADANDGKTIGEIFVTYDVECHNPYLPNPSDAPFTSVQTLSKTIFYGLSANSATNGLSGATLIPFTAYAPMQFRLNDLPGNTGPLAIDVSGMNNTDPLQQVGMFLSPGVWKIEWSITIIPTNAWQITEIDVSIRSVYGDYLASISPCPGTAIAQTGFGASQNTFKGFTILNLTLGQTFGYNNRNTPVQVLFLASPLAQTYTMVNPTYVMATLLQ